NPHLLRLAGNLNGKRVLDAGCGNGYLARKLARLGGKVTGVEPASAMFEHASMAEHANPLGITYLQEDLSTYQAHEANDLVIANMVLMDIPQWQPALQNCINALVAGGTLIISISHPAFEQSSAKFHQHNAVMVADYLHEYDIEATYGHMFHRPLSTYLNFIIQRGCVLTEIVEPQLSQELAASHPDHRRDHYVPSFLIIAATKQ